MHSVKALTCFPCATAAALLLCGCATMGNGFDQQIGIVSVPAAAHVIVDGKDSGVTPRVLNLSRDDSHQIRLEYPGYTPQELTLSRHLSRWGVVTDAQLVLHPFVLLLSLAFPYATPILIGSFVVVDVVTGGLFEFRQDHITATLVPVPP